MIQVIRIVSIASREVSLIIWWTETRIFLSRENYNECNVRVMIWFCQSFLFVYSKYLFLEFRNTIFDIQIYHLNIFFRYIIVILAACFLFRLIVEPSANACSANNEFLFFVSISVEPNDNNSARTVPYISGNVKTCSCCVEPTSDGVMHSILAERN